MTRQKVRSYGTWQRIQRAQEARAMADHASAQTALTLASARYETARATTACVAATLSRVREATSLDLSAYEQLLALDGFAIAQQQQRQAEEAEAKSIAQEKALKSALARKRHEDATNRTRLAQRQLTDEHLLRQAQEDLAMWLVRGNAP